MPLRRSRSLELAAAIAIAAAATLAPGAARGQACCAGSSAFSPGRLAMHEDYLVGAAARGAYAFGSFDGRGHYATNPRGSSEVDLEQDVLGAVRVLGDGQVAVLVPFVQTYRQAQSTGSEIGGGIGDVNLAVRWDFLVAGQSTTLPGIGLLAGLTFPTGRPPEEADTPLATSATGIGAFQANAGLAIEQAFGAWLVNVTGIVAKRTPREVQGFRSTLGTQWTFLGALAYAFPNEASLAGVVSYSIEGDATVGGHDVPDSGRRLLRTSVAAAYPLTDRLRLQASVFFDPPLVYVGQNQLTTIGASLGAIVTWH
jgi:hypothetical protein